MAATSVSGRGTGSAASGVQGPHNGRDVYVPLLTPHVVFAGSVALVGGTKTITFPTPLTGSNQKYVVICQSLTANAARPGSLTNNSDGNFVSFVITGTGTDRVHFSVISGSHYV